MLTLDDIDTRDLLARAQAGDRDAFTAVYTRYRRLIYAVAYQYHRAHAEDVAQDVWCKVLRSLHTWHDTGISPGPWLKTIAVNVCRDRAASAYVQRVIVCDAADLDRPADPDRTDPAVLTAAHLSRRDVLAGLEQISADRREALVLYYLRELSVAETAQAMGATQVRVQNLLKRGRRSLADAVAGGDRR